MSHRRPPTVADRFIQHLEERHPALQKLDLGPLCSFDPATIDAMYQVTLDEHVIPPEDPVLLYRAFFESKLFVSPYELSLWTCWRASRQVYRFDRTLSQVLTATPCPNDMPLDPLRRLPYDCLFVEARCDMSRLKHHVQEYHGFFCWRDVAEYQGADGTSKHMEWLNFIFTSHDGHEYNIIRLELGDGDLESSIDLIVTKTQRHYADTFGIESDRDQSIAELRNLLSFACAHLLYIIADNSDQEVVYKPAGTTKGRRSKRQTCSTIHDVGTRVGRALGEARVRYVGDAGHKGDGTRKVAAHLRSGHWHHFWRGPRSRPDERELIVRWVSPVLVNAGKSSGLASTVVHDATRRLGAA